MILGIDASNIREGGALSYFAGMMNAADPTPFGIDLVKVFACATTLDRMPDKSWLVRCHVPALDRPLPFRVYWQNIQFPREAADCDIVFAPGSNAPFSPRPLVSLSANMLPWDRRELRRFGLSWTSLRLLILSWSQRRTFERTDGLIFLSEYAKEAIGKKANLGANTAVIPHGINPAFRAAPRASRRIEECSEAEPFRLLYVSIVDVYKHQWHVAEAVAKLRAAGLPVTIEFVGSAYPQALARLERAMKRLDPEDAFLQYRGLIPHEALPALYRSSDLFVFASSCENLPNIMIEAMAAGLPIASSTARPMPEVLGDAGVYFDPEKPNEIEGVLNRLIHAPEQRRRLAELSYEASSVYSWGDCADRTMEFIAATCNQFDLRA